MSLLSDLAEVPSSLSKASWFGPTSCCCSRIAFSKESGYANAATDLTYLAPAAEPQIREAVPRTSFSTRREA